MAVACGADLVLELPTVWAMSTAERLRPGRCGGPDAHRRGDGAAVRLRERRHGGADAVRGLSGQRRLDGGAGCRAGGRPHLCRPPPAGGGSAAGTGGRGAAGQPQQHAGSGVSSRHPAAEKPADGPHGAAHRRTARRSALRRLRLGIVPAAAAGSGGDGAGGGLHAPCGGGHPAAAAGRRDV